VVDAHDDLPAVARFENVIKMAEIGAADDWGQHRRSIP